ncbi:MAG: glycosyltransferase family 4 protein [Gemmatimonadaceae bacterium]|nr:glycosyltransferase family 4 protein [Gemmatimonadaceae bacterium]
MICLLHGWLLEGSGSNLWTRSIITALARSGETVHLVCQENHPDRYDAIAEAYRHRLSGEVETTLQRDTRYPGKCILHQPEIGETLPVFVKDKYEEYDHVVPMVELPDDEIELYIARNVEVVLRIVKNHDISAIHANHVVLMPVVAQRVSSETGVPYAVMPHGSGIEYAVKKDYRFRRYASSALADAKRVFVIGEEMRERVIRVFNELPGIESKFTELHLGVDASQFEPVARQQREQNIALLETSLAGAPRGKTAEQSQSLRESVSGSLEKARLKSLIDDNARYDGKLPDADVEDKLRSVSWSHDRVLLFTGRIISPKGIQSVIAALPPILEQAPDLRLVIVGHGPLREPMEAMIAGLVTGDRALVRNIVAWSHWIEGAPEGEESSDDLAGLTKFFDALALRGEEDRYFEAAQRLLRPDTVIFTGYLTHRELRFLFPCCDVGVFPSIVREAGPLVFLEALASGCFPIGTYFGGMAASIDAVSSSLPEEVAAAMKLGLADTVDDLIRQVPRALNLGGRYKEPLAHIARESYDWVSVAKKLREELRNL